MLEDLEFQLSCESNVCYRDITMRAPHQCQAMRAARLRTGSVPLGYLVDWHAGVPSTSSRSFRAKLPAPKGFWRNVKPPSTTPWSTLASSVYPDMYNTFILTFLPPSP